VLFDATIRENIAYGFYSHDGTEVPLEAVRDAARQACIADFIEHLPAQYETRVGAGGCLLSGGQKQRIAIARALMRHPAILLFDEATSALDCNSEAQIQGTLASVGVGRTCIIIAHRLTTAVQQKVDHILYLERGTIVEQGTHEQLIALRGNYWQLYNQQMQITQRASSGTSLDRLDQHRACNEGGSSTSNMSTEI